MRSSLPRRSWARRLTAAIVTVVALVMGAPASSASRLVPPAGPPSSLDALGDSITRGFNACGFYVDCTSRSFSAGDSSDVNSQYLRLLALNAELRGHNAIDAVSGAKVADLARQAQRAVYRNVDYVTILIGANDACADDEASMTSVADYRAAFERAMRTLGTGLPSARIAVLSIPDLRRLWEAGKGNVLARTAWSLLDVCPSMLSNPTSTRPADVARRERVHQRVADFNAVMADVCARTRNCRSDANAVFNYRFTLNQVSKWDYFHPNAAGQAELARITYAAIWSR